MTTAYELAHGRGRLRALIEFALREGWQVRRAADGRLIFTKGSAYENIAHDTIEK